MIADTNQQMRDDGHNEQADIVATLESGELSATLEAEIGSDIE